MNLEREEKRREGRGGEVRTSDEEGRGGEERREVIPFQVDDFRFNFKINGLQLQCYTFGLHR